MAATMRELLVLGILLVSSVCADTFVHTPLPLETESHTLPPVLTGEQIFKSLGISIPDLPVTITDVVTTDVVTTDVVTTDVVTNPAQTPPPVTLRPLEVPTLPTLRLNELDSQILGILNPPADSGDPLWPPYMDELWPDIMLASANLPVDRDIVGSMMAYMPIVAKLLEYQAKEKGEELTESQKYQLAWTNRYIPPFIEFARNVSLDKYLFNDAPLNEAPNNELTDEIFSLLPDVSDIIVNLKKKYGGFPGSDKSLDIMEAFMPIAYKTVEYRANKEGRNVTKDETDRLNFSQKVVPQIMAYSQAAGKGEEKAFENRNIMKLITKAYNDEILHLKPQPTDGRLHYQGNNPHIQARPQHGNTHFQDNRIVRPQHHQGNTYHRQAQPVHPHHQQQHQPQHQPQRQPQHQPQPQPQHRPQHHQAGRPVVHRGPPPVHYYQPQHPVGKRKRPSFLNRLLG